MNSDIPGSGCRVPGYKFRVPDAGCRVPGAGLQVPGAGCRVPGAGCRVPTGTKLYVIALHDYQTHILFGFQLFFWKLVPVSWIFEL
jgi:hypothetical protein